MTKDEMDAIAEDFKRESTALLAKIKANSPWLKEDEARAVMAMSYFEASRTLALELAELKSDMKPLIEAAHNQTWQIKMVGDGSFQYVLPWYTVTEKEYESWPGRKRHCHVVDDVDPVAAPANPIQHEGDIARFVNQVRDIAKDYSQTQQLRERLAQVLVPVLKELADIKHRTEGLEK